LRIIRVDLSLDNEKYWLTHVSYSGSYEGKN
jgi:hypothetical protein